MLLGVLDKGVQGLAQRGKPKTEINQLGILQRDLLLVVHHFAVQRQRLELAMRGGDQGAARSLIEAAALDADEAVLHQVDAADRIARADLIQQFHDLHRLQLHAVDRDGLAFDKANLHHFLAVGCFLRRAGHHPGGGQGRVAGILQLAALMADVPQVAIAGVDLLPARRHRDAVRFGIVQAILARLQRSIHARER